MAIKVFFHICAINRAEEIVKKQVQMIHFSGLYDDAEKIYCYISGENYLIEKICTFLHSSGQKFAIIKCCAGDISYERLTLEDIHSHVNVEDKILYIHSKGVSINYEYKSVDDWVYVMMYYLVRYYKKCLDILEKYDTVGVNYGKIPRPHWSGNFWWVTGRYLLTLPCKIGPHYYDPEHNFLFMNNPSAYEIYNTEGVDLYHNRYEAFKYIDNKL